MTHVESARAIATSPKPVLYCKGGFRPRSGNAGSRSLSRHLNTSPGTLKKLNEAALLRLSSLRKRNGITSLADQSERYLPARLARQLSCFAYAQVFVLSLTRARRGLVEEQKSRSEGLQHRVAGQLEEKRPPALRILIYAVARKTHVKQAHLTPLLRTKVVLRRIPGKSFKASDRRQAPGQISSASTEPRFAKQFLRSALTALRPSQASYPRCIS